MLPKGGWRTRAHALRHKMYSQFKSRTYCEGEPKKSSFAQKLRAFNFRQILNKSPKWTFPQILGAGRLLVVGTGLWLVLGTGTALSFAGWLFYTLADEEFQEKSLVALSSYVTRSIGIEMQFAKFKANSLSSIQFKDVHVLRDPKKLPPEQRNSTSIDLTIDTVDVNLNLLWFMEGKGPLKTLKVSKVRGVLDRREVKATGIPTPKLTYSWGSFELQKLNIDDVRVDIYNGKPDRPLELRILNLECDRLRQQWLLHDLLTARQIIGIFDGSLFSVHRKEAKRQPGKPYSATIKIDGIAMDILSENASHTPLGWMKEGQLNVTGEMHITPPVVSAYIPWLQGNHKANPGSIQILADISLRNIVAYPPLFAPDLSYVEAMLVHPICAYLNSNYNLIELDSDILLDISEFDGSWYPEQALIWHRVGEAVYTGFEKLVLESQKPSGLSRISYHVLLSVIRAKDFVWSQIQSSVTSWFFANQLWDGEHPELEELKSKYNQATTTSDDKSEDALSEITSPDSVSTYEVVQ